MCGRFTLRTPLARVAELFDFPTIDDQWKQRQLRFNIAPTQAVVAIRRNPESGQRELVALDWGLVPHWADDPAIGNRMINARAETVATKPAFRDAFRRRRCLVLADGFFEWKRHDGAKQPYYIHLTDDRPFAFAGLWDRWDKFETAIETCTIITTQANELLRPLHDRMPVIFDREQAGDWVAAGAEGEELEALLRPYSADAMVAYPVSTLVNNPRQDVAQCIEPAEPQKMQRSLFD